MKVSDLLRNTQKTLFTFEILPPLKGGSFAEIRWTIEPLLEFAPSYINVTSHRADISYRTKADGETERVLIKKRPGNVGIAAAVKFRYGIEVVPHVICAGFTRDQIEDELIDFHHLEMQNLLVLRGDKMKSEPMFVAENGGHAHAIDLLKQVRKMNRGEFLHSEIETVNPTDFSCGVAGYPEKHSDAPDLEQDLHYLKEKVDAGADYVVTQMFFDNSKYFEFVDKCRQAGITVPIVPGVKPIATLNQVDILPKLFNLKLPEPLEHALRQCQTGAQAKDVGTEWLIAQAKELKAANVPAIHIYTFGIPDNVVKVCKAVF